MMRTISALFVLLAIGLTGCSTTAPAAYPEAESARHIVITDSLEADPAIEILVAPFRERMVAQTAEVIGELPEELTEGRPEGTLGNFAADAMLAIVQEPAERPVDMAITNNGGLRTTIGPGPVSVGQMFELMPFENMLIVLDFTAAQVDSLAQQLARSGGDPIAGFSLTIDGDARRAVDVQVGGAPLDPDRTYRIVTSDYLANGGGAYPALWLPVPREEVPVALRDAFIEHLRRLGTTDPVIEGRIRLRTTTP